MKETTSRRQVCRGRETNSRKNVCVVCVYLPEAGVLKENPPVGFCANRDTPRPREEVVVVEAGAVAPRAPPRVNPPVPAAAGVLEKGVREKKWGR